MTPLQLHNKLNEPVFAVLEHLRGELERQGVPSCAIDNLSADLGSVQATVAWAFLIPWDGRASALDGDSDDYHDHDISVGIEVLRSDALFGEDVPPGCVNFELTIATVDGFVMCAYQPCKFTTEQWVPLADWDRVNSRFLTFSVFAESVTDFIIDHLRVRTKQGLQR